VHRQVGRDDGERVGHDQQHPEVLLPLAEAQKIALAGVQPLAPLATRIDDALGLVAAEDVVAPDNVPPFENSAMDGYALRAEDTSTAPVELEVVGLVAAGSPPEGEVGHGQAVQIMTGGPVPAGATGIAIVERTERAGDRVRILDPIEIGAHLRGAGSDIKKGAVVVRAGTFLTPAHIGVLASIGTRSILAYRRPSVGVVSTGDELVEASEDPLRPGQIRDSNRHAVVATLRRDGFVPVDLGIVGDTEEAVTRAIDDATARCDALLTTGGVSKGEFDFVKVVLAKRDTAVHVLSVGIRPAKPLVIAFLPRLKQGGDDEAAPMPVFGLPGNPVSCLVSYQVIALPALRVLAGFPPAPPPTVPAVAGEDMPRRPDGKIHLLRVNIAWRDDGRLEARLTEAYASTAQLFSTLVA